VEFGGEVFVGLAGLQVAGGVVVADDDADGAELEGFFKDDTGVDDGGGDAALADDLDVFLFDAAALVEVEDYENFVGVVFEEGAEVGGGGPAVFDDGFFEGGGGLSAAAEFEGGGDGDGFGEAYSLDLH